MEDKLVKEGLLPEDVLKVTDNEEYSPMQQKLVNRYHAIDKVHKLYEKIESTDITGSIDKEAAKEAAKEVVKTCLDNKPDWSERPFLQKINRCVKSWL
ncbi:hypothetical protein [Legionella tunisiensis]|uniref:hypothetical protein n=1 Tax=Legionella tunisiensis TaxID=1034944 RepID=UPI0002D8A31C|nr:hypothetical protein [Legionella tunisiensis]